MGAASKGENEGESGDTPRRGGCGLAAALSIVVFVAIWLAAVTGYGLVAEQWEIVRPRRALAHHWVFGYAPLIALGFALLTAFVVMRRRAAARMTLLILSAGLVALFGGILFLGVGGLI